MLVDESRDQGAYTRVRDEAKRPVRSTAFDRLKAQSPGQICGSSFSTPVETPRTPAWLTSPASLASPKPMSPNSVQMQMLPEVATFVGEASFASTFNNALKSLLGSGLLTMPYAFSATGMYPGILLTTVFAVWSFYTSALIAKCTQRVPSAITYDDVAEAAFGRAGRWLGAFILVLNQLNTCSAYLVFAVMNFASVILVESPGNYPWWLVAAAYPLFVLLACLRNMSSLAIVSTMGNICVVFSLGTILAVAAPQAQWSAFGAFDWPSPAGVSTFFGIAAFTFAGQGEVIPIYLSMEKREDYGRVLCGVGSLSLLVNVALGALVFSAYGDNTKDNLFENLEGVAASIAKVGMSSVMYASLPLKLFPAVQVVEAVLIADDPAEPDDAPACPFITDPRRIAVRSLLALVPTAIAMVLKSFGFLTAFGGAFCLGIVGFVLPPIMYVRLDTHGDGSGLVEGLSARSRMCHIALGVLGVMSTCYATTKVVCAQVGLQC